MGSARVLTVLVPVASLAMGTLAAAQTVGYDNFAPGMGYNHGLPAAAVYGPAASNWAHGIPFTAEATGFITSIDLALRHRGGVNDFVVRLQADDAGGVPGSILATWHNIEGFANAGDPPVHVPADGTVEIVSGVRYWMVVWATGDAYGNWHPTTLVDPGMRAWGQQGGTNWSLHSITSPWAFRILLDESGICYANCTGSTEPPLLTVDDFTCFINEFASAQALPHEQQVGHYANCDGSTTMPALTVDDFTCFINEFAAGCP